MRKVILIVFVVLLGYAGYWLWWEDGGGNAPISIVYEVEARGDMAMLRMMGLPKNFRVAGDLSVIAKPNAVKIVFDIDMTGMEKTNAEVIIRADKQTQYSILHDEEVYSMKKVKLVPKSKSEDEEDNDGFDWFDVFEAKVDGKWFGEEGEKYYARKHVIKDLSGMSSGASGIKVELWFSDDIRLGRKHIGTINKLIRLDSGSFSGQKKGGEDDKRPQVSKDDFPYFPLPLKISLSFKQQSMGWFALEAEAKKVSRKRVSKSDFEPPAGYEKISEKEFEKRMKNRFPMTGIGRIPGQ